jgi:pimeloyl-ACP methyl ester carboxylesterase
MQTADNPDGPLTPEKAQEKSAAFERDRGAYFEQFTTAFFSADGVLQVTEAQRREAIVLCEQSAQHAALACMDSFATTDFREDLKRVTVPALVIHGGSDAVVPFEGSGQRTHRAVTHSKLITVSGAPHGLNVSHAPAFNDALLTFLLD